MVMSGRLILAGGTEEMAAPNVREGKAQKHLNKTTKTISYDKQIIRDGFLFCVILKMVT